MKKIIILITIFTTLISLNSCGSSSSKSNLPTRQKNSDISYVDANLKVCTQQSKNQFVYELLKDSYYWADSVPDIDPSRFSSENELLDTLRDKEDRFSFIIDLGDYKSGFESDTNEGIGVLNATTDMPNTTIVLFVYPNSPADKAGIKRSDLLYLKSSNGDYRLFDVTSNSGKKREVTIKIDKYIKHEIADIKVLNQDGKKIGYFVLNSFIGESINSELDQTFAYFKEQNINELVLDLRYNGGGRLDIATHLATLIGGQKTFSHIFQHHVYNKKYSQYDEDSYFDRYSKYALNLDRVFILTTNATASASESVISALRAKESGMEVITIGERSYGKPYSMYPIKYCDSVIFPIIMKNINTDWVEDYDYGFEPICKVKDDYYHNFGDLNESMLSEALYFVKNGSCKR